MESSQNPLQNRFFTVQVNLGGKIVEYDAEIAGVENVDANQFYEIVAFTQASLNALGTELVQSQPADTIRFESLQADGIHYRSQQQPTLRQYQSLPYREDEIQQLQAFDPDLGSAMRYSSQVYTSQKVSSFAQGVFQPTSVDPIWEALWRTRPVTSYQSGYQSIQPYKSYLQGLNTPQPQPQRQYNTPVVIESEQQKEQPEDRPIVKPSPNTIQSSREIALSFTKESAHHPLQDDEEETFSYGTSRKSSQSGESLHEDKLGKELTTALDYKSAREKDSFSTEVTRETTYFLQDLTPENAKFTTKASLPMQQSQPIVSGFEDEEFKVLTNKPSSSTPSSTKQQPPTPKQAPQQLPDLEMQPFIPKKQEISPPSLSQSSSLTTSQSDIRPPPDKDTSSLSGDGASSIHPMPSTRGRKKPHKTRKHIVVPGYKGPLPRTAAVTKLPPPPPLSTPNMSISPIGMGLPLVSQTAPHWMLIEIEPQHQNDKDALGRFYEDALKQFREGGNEKELTEKSAAFHEKYKTLIEAHKDLTENLLSIATIVCLEERSNLSLKEYTYLLSEKRDLSDRLANQLKPVISHNYPISLRPSPAVEGLLKIERELHDQFLAENTEEEPGNEDPKVRAFLEQHFQELQTYFNNQGQREEAKKSLSTALLLAKLPDSSDAIIRNNLGITHKSKKRASETDYVPPSKHVQKTTVPIQSITQSQENENAVWNSIANVATSQNVGELYGFYTSAKNLWQPNLSDQDYQRQYDQYMKANETLAGQYPDQCKILLDTSRITALEEMPSLSPQEYKILCREKKQFFVAMEHRGTKLNPHVPFGNQDHLNPVVDWSLELKRAIDTLSVIPRVPLKEGETVSSLASQFIDDHFDDFQRFHQTSDLTERDAIRRKISLAMISPDVSLPRAVHDVILQRLDSL